MRNQTASFPVTLCLLALLALAVPARAQEPALEDYRDRLPERTLLCVSWQNLSDLEALRATNPVLRVLASPEMKANWKALEDYQRERAKRKSGAEKPDASAARSLADFGDLAQLMTNPGFMALLAPPLSSDASTTQSEPELLFLYDATGKEDLLAQLNAENRKPGEKWSTYEFEGVTVEETRNAEDKPKRYQARLGRWLIGGSEKTSFEAWLRALREPPTRALRDTAAYQQAQSLWSPASQVRGFLNVALLMDTLRAAPPRNPGDPTPAQLFEALDLHRWQLLTFDASLDTNGLRYQVTGHQGGDPDGLLGLLGSPVGEFPSLRLAPANSIAYSVAQVDLLATLNYLLAAADALAPPQQVGMIQGVLAMAEGLLGAPLEQVMATWGPEYAQFSHADTDGTLRSLYALSLRDYEQAVAMLRHVAAQKVIFLPIEEISATGEGPGETAYFRLISSASENNEPPKPALHIAVTGNWLLVSERKEELEAALARAGGGSPFLGQSPAYQQTRGRFPASLSGFSFLDADRWLETDAAKELFRAILEGAARTSVESEKQSEEDPESNANPDEDQPPGDEPVQAEEPPVPFPELEIPRGYLKWLLSATTRDAHSFRFVGIIE
jgi:hypothetical protein